jgi:hydrogenase maturation protease
MDRKEMGTLILGLGNPILTDDGVGINIARKIKEENPELEVVETSEGGFALLDHIAGCDKLIIIDAIKTGKGKPGELYKLAREDLKPAVDFSSSHGVDITAALEVGEALGYTMPQSVSIYAVEIRDNTTFGEQCTKEVEERIPFIANQIVEEEKL